MKINRYFLFAPVEQPKVLFLNQNNFDAYEATKNVIQSKLDVLDKYLEHLKKGEDPSEIIVLGCEDFFGGAYFHDSMCLDLKAAYEMFSTAFVDLSKKYPKIILCPGSLYVSAPIPKEHHAFNFKQMKDKQSLKITTCYTTNLMPVLYNGKLLRIIRKGEKVELDKVPLSSISVLDRRNNEGNGALKVVSYHEDNLTDLSNDKEGLTSTCYLGKTLLPNEEAYIKQYLDIDITKQSDLFDHEIEIDDKKFCALICGEFNYFDSTQTKVRSTSGKLLQNNHYDYVLHSTIGGDILANMEKNCGVYVHSDFGQLTKLVIDGNKKEMRREKNDDSNLLANTYSLN